MFSKRPTSNLISCRSWRSAFSFVEILFAVAVLGVGFIMIAAVFPVAIRQTDATVDATAARTVANYATALVSGIVKQGDLPPTDGRVAPLPAPLVAQIAGQAIYAPDTRYAFTVAYERATASSDPVFYVFVLRSRSDTGFTPEQFLSRDPNETSDQQTIGSGIIYNDLTDPATGGKYDGILQNGLNNLKNNLKADGKTVCGLSFTFDDKSINSKTYTIGKRVDDLIDSMGNARDVYRLPADFVYAAPTSNLELTFATNPPTGLDPVDVPINLLSGLEGARIRFLDEMGKSAAAEGAHVILADNNPLAMITDDASPTGSAPSGRQAPDIDNTAVNGRQPIANGAIIRLGPPVGDRTSSSWDGTFEVASITDSSGKIVTLFSATEVRTFDGSGDVEALSNSNPQATNPANPRALLVGPPLQKPWKIWDDSNGSNQNVHRQDTLPLDITVIRTAPGRIP